MATRTTVKNGITRFVECANSLGMKQVVCSPGSRNAPLVIALDEHPGIETFVVHDERSAAFFALGLALATNQPVGVCCTSGSAMLNYYPAVAEAFYQCVPLVVLSADRPEEWVNHGDGQTIVQKGVYENHLRFESKVNEFYSAEEEKTMLESIVQDGFMHGNSLWKGPIHFNFPLSEPLYDSVEHIFNKVEYFDKEEEEQTNLSPFLDQWGKFKKKMILCGQGEKNTALLNELVQVADDPSVIVLIESPSNLIHRNFIQCIDRTLSTISTEEMEDFQPDLLLTIGGAIISKKIKQFLRKANDVKHWKVGFEFPEMDTYRHLPEVIQCQSSLFFKEINKREKTVMESNYGSKWKQKDYQFEAVMGDFVSSAPYSDLTVFELILDYIPENSNVHLANSSVVRYAQLFNSIPSLNYFCNRGTSGIDGSASTAIGVAAMTPNKHNVFITGDISFFYDSNAFWNNYLNRNLRVFVINNGGGGIFKIIPGPKDSGKLDKYFNTENSFKIKGICDAFDLTYYQSNNLEELNGQMAEFFDDNSDRPKLMEVNTADCQNEKVLADFFKLGQNLYTK